MEQTKFMIASMQIVVEPHNLCIRERQYELLVSQEEWPNMYDRTL